MSTPEPSQSSIDCAQSGRCSGCPWIAIPYQEQLQAKAAELSRLLSEAGIRPPGQLTVNQVAGGPMATRERVDLTWKLQNGRLALGAYDLTRTEVLDLKTCPLLSANLRDWLTQFRANPPPPLLEKGSVRLRVAPDGRRGVWLDLANIDIKQLLDEGTWLRQLATQASVELGQRHRPLTVDAEGCCRLDRDLRPYAWFETYLPEGLAPGALRATPLFGTIGSFTQPGRLGNRALVEQVLRLLHGSPRLHILELFCGLGNFTLPFGAADHKVTAVELDPTAVECLGRSVAAAGLSEQSIQVKRLNLYGSNTAHELPTADLLFVDPPRSGLGRLLEVLRATPPEHLAPRMIYVSCHGKTLATDLTALALLGYELQSLTGVDQFPHTPHCEWVADLIRHSPQSPSQK